jgi:hypothetical protein
MFSAVSLIVSIVAFVALACQLFMLAQATKLDHARRRKQSTVEYMSITVDKLTQFDETGVPDARDHAAVASLVERAKSGDNEAIKAITNYLTFFNYLGVAAYSDVFDLEVIDRARGGTILAIVANYHDWITFQREKINEPHLYEDLEWLSSRIKSRSADTPNAAELDSPVICSCGHVTLAVKGTRTSRLDHGLATWVHGIVTYRGSNGVSARRWGWRSGLAAVWEKAVWSSWSWMGAGSGVWWSMPRATTWTAWWLVRASMAAVLIMCSARGWWGGGQGWW